MTYVETSKDNQYDDRSRSLGATAGPRRGGRPGCASA